MKHLAITIFIACLFNGCIMHFLIGDEARLQIKNNTDLYLIELSLQKDPAELGVDSNSISLIKERVAPGNKSRVFTSGEIGYFNFMIKAQTDTLCNDDSCRVFYSLGKHILDPGSHLIKINKINDSLMMDFN